MEDVQTFFKERWAPEVVTIHCPSAATLDDMLDDNGRSNFRS